MGLHNLCLCVKAGCHSSPPVAGTLRHGHFSYQDLDVTQKLWGWTALWKWMFFCAQTRTTLGMAVL